MRFFCFAFLNSFLLLFAQKAAAVCDPPILLEVDDITTTSVALSWTPVGSESSWDVAVLPKGSPAPGAPTQSGVTSYPLLYTGLNPGVAYDFYVRAVCGSQVGSWAKYNGFFVTHSTNPSTCFLGLEIPDRDCISLPIEIDTAPGTQLGTDVYLKEVRLIIQHPWDADLDLSLESPSGQVVLLSSDNGGQEDNYGDVNDPSCSSYTTFSNLMEESACSLSSVEEAQAPFVGAYLPEDPLYHFNDGSNPMGTWLLHLCDDAQDDEGVLLFVELVFAAMLCAPPVEVSLVSVDSVSVSLTWLPGNNCSNTLVEYGPAGFVQGTGTLLYVGCPPQTLSGLQPNTLYDFYLSEDCGGGQQSSTTCPFQVQTLCSPPPATLIEDFDVQTPCSGLCEDTCFISGLWRNLRNDEMDWMIGSGPTPTSNTGPDADVSGSGQYAYMEASGLCYSTYSAVLESNCILVEAATGDCHLSFYYYMYGAGVDELELLITTDAGLSWQPLWSAQGEQGQAWLLQNIDLSAYHGQTARFRFVAHRGFQAQGDIALDELRFYGSEDLGMPDQLFYADADGDGYGRDDQTVSTCASQPPPGFSAWGGDCNDANSDIHPDQPETPCNGIDSNCNGMDDENDLPPPVATGDTICSGETPLLQAQAAYFGEIYWYDSDTAGTLLHVGSSWVLPDTFVNNTNLPVSVTFYAEEANFVGCISTERTPVELWIKPLPQIEIVQGQWDTVCGGTEIDLTGLLIQDLLLLNPSYTYHSDFPATPANELPSPLVEVGQASTYYILAEHENCYFTDSIFVDVLPSPVAQIDGQEAFCVGSSQILTAQDLGNAPSPLQYLWSTGQDAPQIEIHAGGPAGSSELYTLTLTAANGCQSSDSLLVSVVESINGVSISTGSVTTCGGADGSIWLSPNGGALPYTYLWSGPTGQGDTSGVFGDFVLYNLPQGSYFFTITDSSPEACSFVLPVILVQGPQANVTLASVQQPSCYGSSDGCIQLLPLSGNPSFLWNTGDTTAVVCGLSAGSYTVTISNGSCQWSLGPVVLENPDSLVVKPSYVQQVSCFGFADGGIQLFVSGGTPPYDFLWSNGSVEQNLSNVPAGLYGLTLTDAAGCEEVLDSVEILEPDSLSVEVLVQEPLCYGQATGSITLLPQGGQTPYVYLWSDGAQTPQRLSLPAGAYGCTLTDAGGCQQEVSVVLTQPDSLSAQLVQQLQPSCEGAEDGLLEVQAVGGTAPFVYTWSHGGFGPLQQNLPQGSYVLSLSDAYGCPAAEQTYLLQAPPGILLDTTLVAPSCLGYADGAIHLQAIQGTIPFSFHWSTGDTTQDLQNIPQGLYDLTVTDAIGCSDTLSLFLEADQPLSYVYSAFAPNCHAANNGLIFLNVVGGQQPYTYLWSNGATTANISDLPSGKYLCTVTDVTGCLLVTDSIALADYPPISIALEALDSISCYGASDGAIQVQVSGGVPPYLYSWSNETTEEDLFGVPAGSYQLTVLDSVQCAVSSEIFVLPDPPLLEAEIEVFEQQGDCLINDVDSLFLSVQGGTGEIQVLWNNGFTGLSIAPVPPGDYQAYLQDAHACTAVTEEVKVPEERPALNLLPLPLPFDTALCDEVQTMGSLQVLIEGGHQPWQYHWSFGLAGTTSADTLRVDSLPQGVYQLTVTDANGCVAILDSLPVFLPSPLLLTPDPDAIQHIACKGDSSGSLGIHLLGGLPPYTFWWTDTLDQLVSQQQNPQHLPAGVYELLVTDSRACEAYSGPYILTEPADSLQISIDLQDNYCYGDSSGWIALTVSGGLPPYELSWEDGSEDENRQMLPAGWYAFTLSDAAACVLSYDSIEIAQPQEPLALLSMALEQPSCNDAQDGNIDIEISGGTPPYDYIWSNNTFLEDPQMLGAGVYSCVVADSLNCLLEISDIELLAPPPLALDSLIVGAHPGMADGSVLVSGQGGTPPYSYLWEMGDTTALLDMLPAGFYALTLTDAHACSLEHVFEVPLVTSWQVATADLFFVLSPNPASAYCDLFWLYEREKTELVWQLQDLQGRLLLSYPLAKGKGHVRLSLTHLPEGVYFWTVQTTEQFSLKKGKLLVLH